MFLDPSGMLAAPWSGFVEGVYRALGLGLEAGAGLAAGDHLGAELEAVAALLEREEKAPSELERRRARLGQRTLLIDQLLPWFPPFAAAVERADEGLFGAMARFTAALLRAHAGELLGRETPAPFRFPEPSETAEPAGGPATGRGRGSGAERELQALLTPARSGLFLSRQDILRLGRGLELPLRYAERTFMLKSLIAAATERGDLGQVLLEIAREAGRQRADLAPWNVFLPGFWQAWEERLGATGTRLRNLAEAAAEAEPGEAGNGS